MSKKVIVVGGGIAGLSAAWELKKRGYNVTVLEAEHEVGGRMRSIKWNDAWWDLGGVQVTDGGVELHAIADELGLRNRRAWYRGGIVDWELWDDKKKKAHYINVVSKKSWLSYGAMSLWQKARVLTLLPDLIKQSRINAKNHATSCDQWLGAWADDESIETWLSRKCPGILETVFEPFFEKYCSQRTWEVSRGSLLFVFATHADIKTLTWDQGVGLVTRTLGQNLNCITNARVTRIDLSKRPLTVEWSVHGEPFKDKADGIIIATEGNLVLGFTQGLDRDRVEFFESVRYNPYDRAYFRLSRDIRPLGANYRFFTRKDDRDLMMLSQGGMTDSAKGKNFFFGKLRLEAMFRQRQHNYTIDQALDELQMRMARWVPEVVEAIDDRYMWRWEYALPCYYPGYLRKLDRFMKLAPITDAEFCGDYLASPSTDAACVSGLHAADRLDRSWRKS